MGRGCADGWGAHGACRPNRSTRLFTLPTASHRIPQCNSTRTCARLDGVPKRVSQVECGPHAPLLLIRSHNLGLVDAGALDRIGERLPQWGRPAGTHKLVHALLQPPGWLKRESSMGIGEWLPVQVGAGNAALAQRTSGSRASRRPMFASSHSNSGASRMRPYLMISAGENTNGS